MQVRVDQRYDAMSDLVGTQPATMSPSAVSIQLVRSARWATLSTLARDPAGYPFGSLVAVAADGHGRPLLLLSRLAEHTQNLLARPEASLLFHEELSVGADPLAAGRVTLLGRCEPAPEGERADLRALFLERHPTAATYVDFSDFSFYRLEPSALRWVGGFGRMTWVSAEEYRAAASAAGRVTGR